MKGDTPAHKLDVLEMDEDTLDAFILNIRERRLTAIRHYEESEKLREEAIRQKLDKQLDHQQKMYRKEAEQLDRVLAKVEKRVLTLRALRLQLED
tara:strand:- start:565 stop:849 length:285 start_codon:yes stop_codon:yes gene_type:complete